MRILKQFLKWIGYLFLVLLATALYWFFTTPEFGQPPSEAQLKFYASSDQHDGQSFHNTPRVNMDMGWDRMLSTLKKVMNPVEGISPEKEIVPLKLDASSINTSNDIRVTWFGHSAFLVEMGGKVLLLDPMLGAVPAPHPWLGGTRYHSEFPVDIDALPEIDLVLYSHDHYDHLDYGTVIKLKDRVKHWLVPLGFDNHLISWGVDSSNVSAFDWWQEATVEGLDFAFTPAQHFSGRGLSDRMQTLWGSWVIANDSNSIYFSGDGGYGNHFKAIGDKYGPFDLGLMECGQYDQNWADIHMFPEETVQAGLDVRAEVIMPIHWGSFTLSLHPWIDPVVRAQAAAIELGVQLTTPRIGEQIIIEKQYPTSNWWEAY